MRIALIPARGGSRRVPRKNVRTFPAFNGQPMLSYPIATAKASGLFDLVAVSTDDAEIATVAFQHGAVVVPREVDDGTTGTQEIAARVLEQLHITHGIACVIYATSPLLLPEDLVQGFRELMSPRWAHFCMSVGPDGQDAGCFYWGWVRAFIERQPLETGLTHRMQLPAERVCDINTPSDWARAESLFTALRRAH